MPVKFCCALLCAFFAVAFATSFAEAQNAPQIPAVDAAKSPQLEIRVFDKETGAPVKAISCIDFKLDAPSQPEQLKSETGVYLFPLDDGGQKSISVAADGYAAVSARWISPSDPKNLKKLYHIELPLPKGQLVSGLVVNEDGKPVKDVGVSVVVVREAMAGAEGFDGLPPIAISNAVSDEKGCWSVSVDASVAKAAHAFISEVPAGYADDSFNTVVFDVGGGSLKKPDSPDGIKFVVKRGVELKGRVVDSDGKPVEGAKVVRMYRFGKNAPLSGKDGSFSVRFASVRSNVSEWLIASKDGLSMGASSISVKDGAFEPMEIKLGKEFRVSGRVLGPDGQPLPGVKIVRTLKLKHPSGNFETSYSDFVPPFKTSGSDGSFEIGGLAESGMSLVFSKAEMQNVALPVSGDASKLEIKMEFERYLTVKACDAETGAELKEFSFGHGFVYKRGPENGTSSFSIGMRESASPRRLPLSQLFQGKGESGTLTVRLAAPGYVDQERKIEIARNALKDETLELRLAKAKHGVDFIKCFVKKPDGSPAFGALVAVSTRVSQPGGVFIPSNGVPVAPDGSTLVSLADPSLELSVSHESGFVKAPLSELKDGMELKLSPWAKVEVRWIGPKVPFLSFQLASFKTFKPSPNQEIADKTPEKAGSSVVFDRVVPGPVFVGVRLRENFSDDCGKWVMAKSGECSKIDLGDDLAEYEASLILPPGKLPESSSFSVYARPLGAKNERLDFGRNFSPSSLYSQGSNAEAQAKEWAEKGQSSVSFNSDRFKGATLKFFGPKNGVSLSVMLQLGNMGHSLCECVFKNGELKKTIDLRDNRALRDIIDMEALPKDCLLDGVIRYPDGRPAEGVKISNFMDVDKGVMLGGYSAVTGKDGVFKVDNLPAVNNIRCWVEAPRGYCGENLTFADLETHKELTLRRATSVHGKLGVSDLVKLPTGQVLIRVDVAGNGSSTMATNPGEYEIQLGVKGKNLKAKILARPFDGDWNFDAKPKKGQPEKKWLVEKETTLSEGDDCVVDLDLR